jgi:hypothetical protein
LAKRIVLLMARGDRLGKQKFAITDLPLRRAFNLSCLIASCFGLILAAPENYAAFCKASCL